MQKRFSLTQKKNLNELNKHRINFSIFIYLVFLNFNASYSAKNQARNKVRSAICENLMLHKVDHCIVNYPVISSILKLHKDIYSKREP